MKGWKYGCGSQAIISLPGCESVQQGSEIESLSQIPASTSYKFTQMLSVKVLKHCWLELTNQPKPRQVAFGIRSSEIQRKQRQFLVF